MRWHCLLILLIKLNISATGQSFDSLLNDLKNNHQSYSGLRKVLDRCAQTHSNLEVFGAWMHWPFFATRQEVFEISSKEESRPWYGLTLFNKKDKIIYFSLIKHDYNSSLRQETIDTVFKYIDNVFSAKVLAKHNKRYHTSFSLKDMYENYPEFYTPYEPSMLLHLSTRISKDMKKIFDAIINKDISLIIQYAAAFSTELKAYGAIGLYIWNKEINALNQELHDLLADLQSSNHRLMYNDGGCLVESSRLSIIVSDGFADRLYSEFLDYKNNKN